MTSKNAETSFGEACWNENCLHDGIVPHYHPRKPDTVDNYPRLDSYGYSTRYRPAYEGPGA